MQVKAEVELLQQIPLFANSDAVHLQFLAFSSRSVSLAAGGFLFRKGDKDAAAYLLLKGTAEIYDDAEGKGEVVATSEAGSLLGELSMIADAAYGVTVRATSALTAKRIDRELFIRLAAEFPEFGQSIMRNVAVRMDRSIHSLNELKMIFQS
jgi:CRP/FNR family cyclic AMP-dependent transcriptional regulator